jgi:hypothetical protein
LLTLEMLLPHLGDTFEVDVGEARPMPVVLVEATALPKPPPQFRQDPFQIKFTGPGPRYLDQMIHRLAHAKLGKMEIFLVPIGRYGDGFLYQAIFN